MELGNVSFFVSEDYFMVCQNSGKFERSHFKTFRGISHSNVYF